jgi:hypothetical protein
MFGNKHNLQRTLAFDNRNMAVNTRAALTIFMFFEFVGLGKLSS